MLIFFYVNVIIEFIIVREIVLCVFFFVVELKIGFVVFNIVRFFCLKVKKLLILIKIFYFVKIYFFVYILCLNI